MKTLPPLGDEATVKLSRQGGVAAIQALTRPREIEFAQCDLDQRQRILNVIEGCLPLDSSQAGQGDRRFYQIEVRVRLDDQLMLQIPEDQAPGELVLLWDKGQVS
ncbi:protealysin inhibitor emfourin [Pseudomonas mucidolens]|uniref:protealysin inhibitor emfourin n=1 Tax=Pseudomonas mucidolens TaxID=46679 RepID=UPI0030DD1C06